MGFYYLNDRYYDSITGRFLTPDDPSYLGANGDLLSYNLYAYCSNNPVMYVDPTGHFVISITTLLLSIALGAALGAGAAFGAMVYEDYVDDGEIFNGSIGVNEYIGTTLGGLIAGAGLGACSVLGAGLGAAMMAGSNLVIGGATISGGLAMGLGLGSAFATGALGYTVRTAFSSQETFEVSDMLIEGGVNMFSGLITFTGSMIGGITGVKIPGRGINPNNFIKYQAGMAFSGAYLLKLYYSKIGDWLKEMY
jgi:RHS repeat-associated protein